MCDGRRSVAGGTHPGNSPQGGSRARGIRVRTTGAGTLMKGRFRALVKDRYLKNAENRIFFIYLPELILDNSYLGGF